MFPIGRPTGGVHYVGVRASALGGVSPKETAEAVTPAFRPPVEEHAYVPHWEADERSSLRWSEGFSPWGADFLTTEGNG